ncbi:energy transducer TonB [Caulobacter soli]|uniref:energy transducer TonB n=1 Tax=Caulobacter soli TaxID=2708539 RepID=UPI0013E9D2FF|nr:energy transducer TonB [Caulobacter soli]
MTRVVSRLRYFRRHPNILAVAGSLLLHVVGAALILARVPAGPMAAAGAEGPGSVQVTLVSSEQARAAPALAPTPAVDQPVAQERPDRIGPVGQTGEAAAPPAEAIGDRGPREQSAQAAQGLQAVSTASAAVSGSDYRARLLAHIQPFRRYPAQAEAVAARGVTQLIFRVDQDGNVVGVWVKASSGFESLDNEAMATVLRAQPMPHVPAGLPSPLTVQLPVSFNPS